MSARVGDGGACRSPACELMFVFIIYWKPRRVVYISTGYKSGSVGEMDVKQGTDS